MHQIFNGKNVRAQVAKLDYLQLFSLSFLALCIMCGILIRLYKLGVVPLAPYWDEVAMLADARQLLATGKDLHGNSWLQPIFLSYGDYKLPVYIWCATIAGWLVGITPLAVRIPSVVAGLGSILLAAILPWQLLTIARAPLSKRQKLWISLSSAAIAAITPWGIVFSRTGFEAHLSQFLTGLSVAVLLGVLLITNHSLRRFLGILIASCIAAAAVYTYFSTRFVVPCIFVSVLSIAYGTDSELLRKKIVQWLGAVSFFLLVFGLSLVPMVLSTHYEASNQYRLSTQSILNLDPFVQQSNTWKAKGNGALIDRVVFHRRVLQSFALARNVSKHFSAQYLFISGDLNLRHGTGRHGILLVTTFPFLLAGWFWLLKHSRATAGVLGLWWLAAVLPAAIPSEVPHALRSLNAFLPAVISIGIGVGVTGIWLQQHLAKQVVAFLLLLVATAAIVEFSGFTQYYFTVYPYTSARAWQHGYTALATMIAERFDTHDVYIDQENARVVLWLMAFAPLEPPVLSDAIRVFGPLPTRLGNVTVGELEKHRYEVAEKPQLFVGSTETIRSFIKDDVRQPRSIIEIHTADPTYQFTAVEYAQN